MALDSASEANGARVRDVEQFKLHRYTPPIRKCNRAAWHRREYVRHSVLVPARLGASDDILRCAAAYGVADIGAGSLVFKRMNPIQRFACYW